VTDTIRSPLDRRPLLGPRSANETQQPTHSPNAEKKSDVHKHGTHSMGIVSASPVFTTDMNYDRTDGDDENN
jgi:hypothetical protein